VKKKFIPTDNITIELLKNYTITNGRNYDVLIRVNNDHITARTLEQLIQDSACKIDHRICHSPETFPWVDHTHLKNTFFKDWTAPSFYVHFRESQGFIITETLPQHTIALEQYIQTARNKIENNVKNLFNNSKNMILLYSGGIDSILLISYLIKYNRLKDTLLIYCYNENADNIIQQTQFHLEKSLGLNIESINVSKQVLIDYANQPDPFKFRNYQSHWVAEKFKNKTILIGNEGNSVLFHKWEWLKRLDKPVTKKNIYVTSCYDSVDWSTPIDLDYNTISFIDPYSRSWNNGGDFAHMLSPISDVSLMQMLPFVDIRNMDPNFVGDARLARTILYDNVKHELDSLITTENINWGICDSSQNLQIKDIDKNMLDINFKKRIETKGLIHMKHKIDRAKIDGHIEPRYLLALKYINYFL
jgi:hypothetical protein